MEITLDGGWAVNPTGAGRRNLDAQMAVEFGGQWP